MSNDENADLCFVRVSLECFSFFFFSMEGREEEKKERKEEFVLRENIYKEIKKK